ncbi:scavenger receptor class B member 1 [Calliphora vicina]|uniref:scavenger receptor class B member 1 n=1 Tax=Calliphora vicina TaxID=7373 RepID=UPI00325B3CF2
MSGRKCLMCKLITLSIIGTTATLLFFISLNVNYQWELAKEHVRFRSGMPSQANWITSPYGRLKVYLFNVTNSEEFLNGTDTRIKFEQVGPIVYKLKGHNEIVHQSHDTLTYRKIRYGETAFDPESSCSPDILNQTIILPNLVLLGAAAKLHDWVFLVRHAFNAITINESVFLTKSINYFLWDFKLPALNMLSNYVPNIVANCGMLFNALREKNEEYNVRIGLDNGMENFFRVNTLNNKTYFHERSSQLKRDRRADDYCPVKFDNAFDNSLFPPFLKPGRDFNIVAIESCRTLKMKYDEIVEHMGLKSYRYTIGETGDMSGCLDSSMGIKLPKGLFDVSKCLFNDVPSAFSAPHFYGTEYNYSAHYEGLNPNKHEHEAHIILEPITGIPIEEKYRFQSNIPMPDMKGYNKDLQKFNKMIIPNFWYEYDLDDLPSIIQFLIKFNVKIVPILQPILMGLFVILAIYCYLKIYLLVKQLTLSDIFRKCCKRSK